MRPIWLTFGILLLASLFGHSQVFIDLKSPSAVSPCQDLPIEVTVSNDGDAAVSNLNILVKYANGFSYINGSVSNAEFLEVGQTSEGASFSLDYLDACESKRFVIWVNHVCIGEQVKEDFEGKVDWSNLTYTSMKTTVTLYKVGIQLINVKLYFDTLDGKFKKQFSLFNTGQVSLESFQVYVAAEDNMGILTTNIGQLSANGDTLTIRSTDFNAIGNGNDYFEPGEHIIVTQEIDVDACLNDFEVIHKIEVDCGSKQCVYDVEDKAKLLALVGVPRIFMQATPGEQATLCRDGEVNLMIRNFGIGGDFDLGRALYSLVLNAGWSIIQGNQRTSPRRDNCLEVFSANVNGTNIPLITGGFSGYGLRFTQLSSDPDGPGGLEDLDGDGFFDDILPGDTVHVQLRYRLRASCVSLSCNGEVFSSRLFRVESDFKDYCHEDFDASHYIGQHHFQWSRQFGSVGGLNLVYGDEEKDTLTINLNRNITGFLEDCEDDSTVVTLTFPPVVEIEPGAIVIVNNDTVDYVLTGNTMRLVAHTTRLNIRIPIVVHCDPNTGGGGVNTACTFCYGSGLPSYRIRANVDYYCRSGCINRYPLFCFTSPAFHALCDGAGAGVASEGKFIIDGMEMHRITLGHSDASETQKVDPADSLNFNDLMTYDTFELRIPFDIRCNANYSNILFQLAQTPIYRGPAQNRDTLKAFEFFADTLKFFDAESGRWSACPNALGNEFFQTGGSVFRNQYVQRLQMNPLFGRCLSGRLSTPDSLVLVVRGRSNDVVTRNVQQFLLRSHMAYSQDGCQQESTGSIRFNVFSGIPAAGSSFLYQPYVQDSLFNRYYQHISVCQAFRFETVVDGYYNQVDNEVPFFNEWRKPYIIDKVKVTVPDFFTVYPTPIYRVTEYYQWSTRTFLSDTILVPASIRDSADYHIVTFDNFHENEEFKAVRHRFVFHLEPDCFGFVNDSIITEKYYRYQLQSSDVNDHKTAYVRQPYPVNVSGVRPDFSDRTAQLLKDTAKVWEFDFYSLTNGAEPRDHFTYRNSWLSFENASGHILIDSLVEIVDTFFRKIHTPQLFNGNRHVYLLDSTWVDRKFFLYTKFDLCQEDSLLVRAGNDCSSYPDFNNLEGQGCFEFMDRQALKYYPEGANIDVAFLNEPDSVLTQPCDTMDYQVEVRNVGLGHSVNNKFEFRVPDGLTFFAAQFVYKAAPAINLPAPTYNASTGFWYWDVDGYLGMDGLPGFYLFDENYYQVYLKFIGDCELEDGSAIGIKSTYLNICLESNTSEVISSRPLNFKPNGTAQDSLYDVQVNFKSDTACGDGFLAEVKLTSISALTNTLGQKVYFLIKKEMNYSTGQILDSRHVSQSEVKFLEFSGWETLEVPIDDAIMLGDSIFFTVAIDRACLAACKTTDFQVKVNVPVDVGCVTAPGGTCQQLLSLQTWEFNDVVMGPRLSIDQQEVTSTRVAGGDEQVSFTYLIQNNSPFSASSQYIIQFYYDSNGDGRLDAGDLFLGRDTTQRVNLSQFDSEWVNAEFLIDGRYSCRVIAVITLEDNECLCFADSLSFTPAIIEPRRVDYLTCFETPIAIGFDELPGRNYLWSDLTRLSNINSSTADYLYDGRIQPGESLFDSLYLTEEKESGCEVIDTIIIEVYRPDVDLILLDPILCHGDSTASIRAEASGPYTSWMYNWQSFNETSPELTNLPVGTYVVEVRDEQLCPARDTIEITQPEPLEDSIFITSDYNGFDISCYDFNDGSVQVETKGGTPGYRYAWNLGIPGSNAQLDELKAGLVQVRIIDDHGCEIWDTITLNQPPPLVIDGSTTPAGCDSLRGGSAEVIVQGGVPNYSYQWEDGMVGPRADALEAGSYKIQIQDANGCLIDTVLEVGQLPDPIVWANIRDTTIEYGQEVVLRVSSNANVPRYLWSPPEILNCDTCSTVRVNTLEDQTIIVEVTDENGCTAWAEIKIHVKITKKVWAPNAITPGGDDLNDGFTIFGNATLEEVEELQIYDRWGELVYINHYFEPNDPKLGWDGTLRGEPLNPAVFVYWARVRFVDGEVRMLQGDVTVIR